MIAKGVLTVWDVPLFAEFCESLVTLRMARLQVNAELSGNIDVQPGGTTGNAVWRTALSAVNTLAAKFGISPADRARIVLPAKEPVDDLISGVG